MAKGLDDEIDRLYQLPLAEFTGARNALAKTAGAGAADVKGLQKPPVAAWAVNQLYWRNRDVYDALIEAANELRSAHKGVLAGKRADLRTAGKMHEEAVEAAITATVDLLAEDGQPPTEATRQAIATTLRALPSADPPGRLTRTLQPGGFEMLAGVPLAAPAAAPARASAAPRAREDKEKKPAGDPKAVASARDAWAAASRALRAAEHEANRDEFEAARAARDVEKAERNLATAREELAAAERAVDEAEREVAASIEKREAAERRARTSDEAVAAARAKSEAARQQLDALGS